MEIGFEMRFFKSIKTGVDAKNNFRDLHQFIFYVHYWSKFT